MREAFLEILSDSSNRSHRTIVIDVFGALFRRPIDSPGLLSMATGETVAHLNRLLATGEATMTVDESGVAWYRAV